CTLAKRPRKRHLLALRKLVEKRLLLLGEPNRDELHRPARAALLVRHPLLLRIACRSYRTGVGRSYRTSPITGRLGGTRRPPAAPRTARAPRARDGQQRSAPRPFASSKFARRLIAGALIVHDPSLRRDLDKPSASVRLIDARLDEHRP